MVNPTFISEEPEPDIDPDIRRRSSIHQDHTHNQDKHADSVQLALATETGAPLPSPLNRQPTLGESVDSGITAASAGSTSHPNSSDGTLLAQVQARADKGPLKSRDFAQPGPIAYGGYDVEKGLGLVNHGSASGGGDGIEGMGLTRIGTRSSTRSAPMGSDSGDDNEKFIEPSFKASFKAMMRHVPILYAVPIMLPIAWALHFTHQSPVAIFICTLVGIVPLAGGLGYATEELAVRVGEAWGGLLNATFGNAVELLIAILALVKGEIDIVQASMVGSILSNILLVLGMSYFAGGLRFHEQMYFIPSAQMQISLLSITLMAVALPAAYHYAYPNASGAIASGRNGVAIEGPELDALLKMSRGLSFVLLAVYAMFLCFQLWTHAYLFRIPREAPTHPLPGPTPSHERVFPVPDWAHSLADSSSDSSSTSSGRSRHSHHTGQRFRRLRRWSVRSRSDEPDREVLPAGNHMIQTQEERDAATTAPVPPTVTAGRPTVRSPVQVSFTEEMPRGGIDIEKQAGAGGATGTAPGSAGIRPLLQNRFTVPRIPRTKETEELAANQQPRKVEPQVSWRFAVGLLVVMTALAGVTAEFLIGSIDGLTETGNVSREFVGLILLPVIGNSVEHITAVTVSVKDKLNLSMSIAVGSSIQVSLCLLPILVLIGWAIGQPMMLFFDTFETIALVLSVLLVQFAIADGRTNYLEGFIMMCSWFAIALVCWFYDPTL